MRYVCLVYFDPKVVFNGSSESNAVLAEVGAYDGELKTSGHLVIAQALAMPKDAITVTVRDGRMATTDGPFMETKEMLAGIVVVEARDLNEAVRLASGLPLAKLGYIEVRPVPDFSKARPKL